MIRLQCIELAIDYSSATIPLGFLLQVLEDGLTGRNLRCGKRWQWEISHYLLLTDDGSHIN